MTRDHLYRTWPLTMCFAVIKKRQNRQDETAFWDLDFSFMPILFWPFWFKFFMKDKQKRESTMTLYLETKCCLNSFQSDLQPSESNKESEDRLVGKDGKFIGQNRTWWTFIRHLAPPQWSSRWCRCRPGTSWCPSFWPWWPVGSMPLKKNKKKKQGQWEGWDLVTCNR